MRRAAPPCKDLTRPKSGLVSRSTDQERGLTFGNHTSNRNQQSCPLALPCYSPRLV